MSIIKEITKLEKNPYKLGEPWKLPKASGFIVPILQTGPHNSRGYRLLQEVENLVDFRDSGSISGVEAQNKADVPIFIRKGTMLKGTGTQSRAPIHSFVLEPNKNYVRVPVNCIHQTHGISTGAEFKAEGVAPLSVQASLGEQSRTWSSIQKYSAKLSALGTGHVTDNLVGFESATQDDPVVDALKNIPGDHLDQVGVAVFDLNGVVAVEIFNSPESWRAFSESIIRSYREVLTEEAGALIEVRTDRAGEVFWTYMKRLGSMEKVIITETVSSKVWSLRDAEVDGETTEIDGEEIHLMLNKHVEHTGEQYDMLQEIMGAGPVAETEQVSYEETQQYVQRKGGFQLLERLSQMPQRFSELLESVDVSRGTLSTRVKEAEDLGLIEKGIRKQNGHPAYVLTEDGEEIKKKTEDKAK